MLQFFNTEDEVGRLFACPLVVLQALCILLHAYIQAVTGDNMAQALLKAAAEGDVHQVTSLSNCNQK
jgi:hypothetical protein